MFFITVIFLKIKIIYAGDIWFLEEELFCVVRQNESQHPKFTLTVHDIRKYYFSIKYQNFLNKVTRKFICFFLLFNIFKLN